MTNISHALEAIKNGKLITVINYNAQEFCGFLVGAAANATTDKLEFLIRNTSGTIYAPMSRETAERLRLMPEASDSDHPGHRLPFAVSVDYCSGLSDGISATDRCKTIQALADYSTKPDDLIRPGHIFPLVAANGGVLVDPSPAEAAVDLCRMAGFPEIAVMGELINDDGSLKNIAQSCEFASSNDLRLVSISVLRTYRESHERIISRIVQTKVATPIGDAHAVSYQIRGSLLQHVAIIWGTVCNRSRVPVWFYCEDVMGDMFCRTSRFNRTLGSFQKAGRGVILYIRNLEASSLYKGLERRNSDHSNDNYSKDLETSASLHGLDDINNRIQNELVIGSQILKDLGVHSVAVLPADSEHSKRLRDFGVEMTPNDCFI